MATTTTHLELAKGDLAWVKVDGRHFRPLDNVVQGVVTCRSFVVSLVWQRLLPSVTYYIFH